MMCFRWWFEELPVVVAVVDDVGVDHAAATSYLCQSVL
jgi:hypothetical protein